MAAAARCLIVHCIGLGLTRGIWCGAYYNSETSCKEHLLNVYMCSIPSSNNTETMDTKAHSVNVDNFIIEICDRKVCGGFIVFKHQRVTQFQ